MASLPMPMSLPYIDLEYNDPIIRQQVDQLIQAELSLSSSSMPSIPPPSPPPEPLDVIDLTRYTNPTTPEMMAVVESMQHDRVHRLTLLKEHGELAWLAHLHQSEHILEQLQLQLESKKSALNDLNRLRKTEQLEAKAHLDYIQHQIDTTKQSNIATLFAIQALEQQQFVSRK